MPNIERHDVGNLHQRAFELLTLDPGGPRPLQIELRSRLAVVADALLGGHDGFPVCDVGRDRVDQVEHAARFASQDFFVDELGDRPFVDAKSVARSLVEIFVGKFIFAPNITPREGYR